LKKSPFRISQEIEPLNSLKQDLAKFEIVADKLVPMAMHIFGSTHAASIRQGLPNYPRL
jgi:hypothetical protein